MTALNRLRVTWTGSSIVGPGVSTFYFLPAGSGFPAAVKTFFTALADRMPSGLTLSIPNTGDEINLEDGVLTGIWTGTGGGTVTCSGSGNYVMGTGARVRWKTAGIINHRRVTGTTFLAPLMQGNFEGSGNLTADFVSAAQTAANALVSAAGTDFQVWSRPKKDQAGGTSSVLAAEVPDATSWLRSRRT